MMCAVELPEAIETDTKASAAKVARVTVEVLCFLLTFDPL
jgi:hypothetical protein